MPTIPPPSPPAPRHLLLQRLHHLPLEETLRPALLIQEMVCLAVPGEGEESMQVTMADLASWLNVLNGEGSASNPSASVSLSHPSFLQHMLLGISFVPGLSWPLEPGQGVGDDLEGGKLGAAREVRAGKAFQVEGKPGGEEDRIH